jgi:lycopene beta-cyclase
VSDFDLILVGGGLANGLIALRLAKLRPEVKVAIVEGAERLGGNHTWSSFDTDMRSFQRAWTARLYARQWKGYSVVFPKYRRVLGTGYASATGEMLDREVRAVVPAERVLLGAPAVTLSPTCVTLGDQRTLTASAVIDGRGAAPSEHLDLRWQKFLGQEVELTAPHGLTQPVVMDASVEQRDGYRFFYVLPFGPRSLLIEDTYYSDGPELDADALRRRIADYAAGRGWTIGRVVREEHGVLPIALGGDIAKFWDEGEEGVARVGMRAALFHPTTGYSFPDAVALADKIAGLKKLDAAAIYAAVREHSEARWRERGFYRMLNKMLFVAAEPAERYRVLERFYRLDEGLVTRFYAGRSTLADKARILIGKPPVPIGRAVRALMKG